MAAPRIKIENLRQFSLEISDFAEQVPEENLRLQKALALDLFTRIVEKNPVGNPDLWQDPPPAGYVGGRSRGNWQIGLNQTTENELNRVDSSGAQTIADGASRIGSAGLPFGVIWIYNNVPYINRLEDGYSSQAPLGMVAVSLAEVEAFFGGV